MANGRVLMVTFILAIATGNALAAVRPLEAFSQAQLVFTRYIPIQFTPPHGENAVADFVSVSAGEVSSSSLLGISSVAGAQASAYARVGVNRAYAAADGYLLQYEDGIGNGFFPPGSRQHVYGQATAQSTWTDRWFISSEDPAQAKVTLKILGRLEGRLAVSAPLPSLQEADAYFSYQLLPNGSRDQVLISERLLFDRKEALISHSFSLEFEAFIGEIEMFSRLIADATGNGLADFSGTAVLESVEVEQGVHLTAASGALLVAADGLYRYLDSDSAVSEPTQIELVFICLLLLGVAVSSSRRRFRCAQFS